MRELGKVTGADASGQSCKRARRHTARPENSAKCAAERALGHGPAGRVDFCVASEALSEPPPHPGGNLAPAADRIARASTTTSTTTSSRRQAARVPAGVDRLGLHRRPDEWIFRCCTDQSAAIARKRETRTSRRAWLAESGSRYPGSASRKRRVRSKARVSEAM